MTQQLIGPFKANQELCPTGVIQQLGIQLKSLSPQYVFINDKEIEIRTTEMYELTDVEITSLRFKHDMDNNTIIEYVLK